MKQCLLSLLILSGLFSPAQDQGLHEEMRVLQYALKVRVTDRGKALKNLGPADFLIKNHGKEITADFASWTTVSRIGLQENVSGDDETIKEEESALPEYTRAGNHYIDTSIEIEPKKKTPKTSHQEQASTSTRGTEGRFIAIFIQNDLASNRNQGLLRMVHHGKRMIKKLKPDDWIAVFSFDSHLKMHLDFTRDHKAAIKAVNRCLKKVPGKILFGGPFPSIADAFNVDEAEKAADPETGLRIIAETLEGLPGEKLLAYIGWGFGSLDESGVKLDRRYDKLQAALYTSNVTVFSMDLTVADYHSLEVAMKRVAFDTGGFYERTANHPEASINRFIGSIEGYYLVSFAITETKKAPDFKITIKGRPTALVTYSRNF